VGYNCVVCVKQVPDTKQITGEAMTEEGTVNRAALPAIFNPEDLNALEEALAVRDSYGGTVTVVTMGAPACCQTLRDCLFRGADRVISISNVGNGYEVVSGKLPVLVTVMDNANTPRPPAVKKVMKFKKARSKAEVEQMAEHLLEGDYENYTAELKASEVEKYCAKLAEKGLLIDQWSLEDLEADLTWCGMSGSPTKVHRIQSVVLTGGEYKEFPPTDAGVATMVAELIEEHTIG